MEFGIKKCGMLLSIRRKVVKLMPDGERTKKVKENGYRYKYLGILEHNKVKEREMKANFRREYLRRMKSIIQSTLNDGIEIMVAVSLARYGTGIAK